MKITALLRVTRAATLGGCIALAAVVGLTAGEMEQIGATRASAFDIARGAGELHVLTQDFLRHPSERALMQWNWKYDAISAALKSLAPTESTRELVRVISRGLESTRLVFDGLRAPPDPQLVDEPIAAARLQMLERRLSIELQSVLSRTHQLTAQTARDERQAWRLGLMGLGGVLGVLLLIVTGSTWSVGRRVMQPLARLRRGMAEIGSGHLDYRVGIDQADEIGELSRQVDEMAMRLKAITASKADLERETALRELAQQAGHIGVFEWNLASGRIAWSAEMERLFGLAPLSFEGDIAAWCRRLEEADAQRLRGLAEAAHGGGEVACELRGWLPDGRPRWFSLSARLFVGAQGAERLIGACIDTTEQRRMVDALRDADRRKDEFLAMLAHELRNPMAPIANAVEVLKRAGSDPETAQRARAMIERQIQHLRRLVDDLLDVSRITRGKIALQTGSVTLQQVVERAVETAMPLIEAHRHRLAVSLPPQPVWLHVDEVRIAQVISNLLNNAAKYTDAGGSIELAATLQTGEVSVFVRDTGIGIPPALLPRVFELFSQAERSLDRAEGGLGIGLTLARKLVELHGGSITARSEGSGQGSEFQVRLPCMARVDNRAAEVAGYGRPDGCVLVIDDDDDRRESLALLLGVVDRPVATAGGGRSGLAVALARRPEVVILDLGLPDLDGHEVARRIREAFPDDCPLLVALTGSGHEAAAVRGGATGFDDYLVKPVDPGRLLALIGEQRWHRPGRGLKAGQGVSV